MRFDDTANRRLRRKLTRAKRKLRAVLSETSNGSAVSPLAPKDFPNLPEVVGLRLATASAGVKYQGRTDVLLAVMEAGTSMAGLTTTSATRAAPVLDCESKLADTRFLAAPAAIVVNSGNANAFTGGRGQTAVAAVTKATAAATGVPEARVFTSSTGVIGEPLPAERIVAVLEDTTKALSPNALKDAALAIMTTDTFPKGAGATLQLGGEQIAISGIAKGSGMIAPDMATMLVYIFTDARISPPLLQAIVTAHNANTFNSITVDSDTSTSDTLLVAATGCRGPELLEGTPETRAFSEALHKIMQDLAHQVVRDGEGATKFVEVQVTGAATQADAKLAARAIANSPLVKTAIAGEDPNWGRVVMAVGKSGAAADRDKLSIWFGPHLVAENGWVSPEYREETGADYMLQSDLVLRTDLGIGEASATVWTCDLTHGYITINADYRS